MKSGKRKFQFRNVLSILNNDLEFSRKASAKLNVSSKKNVSLGANFKTTKNSIDNINQEIEIIKEKQNEILNKVLYKLINTFN